MATSPAGSRRAGEPGFTPRPRSPEHGFTLIELMLVVTLIALASAAVALALPDPRGRVRDEATRFAGRARAARDLAIVESRPISLWVTAGGYGFDRRQGGGWAPMSEKPLRVQSWEEGTAAQAGARRERLTYDPTGFADGALGITLTRGGASATVALGADGSIRVDG